MMSPGCRGLDGNGVLRRCGLHGRTGDGSGDRRCHHRRRADLAATVGILEAHLDLVGTAGIGTEDAPRLAIAPREALIRTGTGRDAAATRASKRFLTFIVATLAGPTTETKPGGRCDSAWCGGPRPFSARKTRQAEARRKFEVVGREKMFVGEDLSHLAVGDDAPGRQDHRAVAQLGGERKVVRDDQKRPVDYGEQLQQLASGPGIEVCRRLIEHERLRIGGEHRCNRDTATLSHRELMGSTVDRMRHPHKGKRLVDARTNPATSSCPADAISRPLRCSINVVLPAPLGPSTATRSP